MSELSYTVEDEIIIQPEIVRAFRLREGDIFTGITHKVKPGDKLSAVEGTSWHLIDPNIQIWGGGCYFIRCRT